MSKNMWEFYPVVGIRVYRHTVSITFPGAATPAAAWGGTSKLSAYLWHETYMEYTLGLNMIHVQLFVGRAILIWKMTSLFISSCHWRICYMYISCSSTIF